MLASIILHPILGLSSLGKKSIEGEKNELCDKRSHHCLRYADHVSVLATQQNLSLGAADLVITHRNNSVKVFTFVLGIFKGGEEYGLVLEILKSRLDFVLNENTPFCVRTQSSH